MEKLNIYSPTSASFVSEPYGLSEFHKWVIPQIIKDSLGEFSPIECTEDEIQKMETILSESKYFNTDKELLNTKYIEWMKVYIPPSMNDEYLTNPNAGIYDIVPKQFKKSIYEP